MSQICGYANVQIILFNYLILRSFADDVQMLHDVQICRCAYNIIRISADVHICRYPHIKHHLSITKKALLQIQDGFDVLKRSLIICR